MEAELQEKIESNQMLPADWARLDRTVPAAEYRRIVLAYQKREDERRPRCRLLFGLCRNYAFGKCTAREWCGSQERREK